MLNKNPEEVVKHFTNIVECIQSLMKMWDVTNDPRLQDLGAKAFNTLIIGAPHMIDAYNKMKGNYERTLRALEEHLEQCKGFKVYEGVNNQPLKEFVKPIPIGQLPEVISTKKNE